MEQYISKSALLAEIERLKEEIESQDYAAYTDAYIVGVKHTLETISDTLDTLEVKEVGVDFGDPEGDKSAICIIDTKTLKGKEVDLEKEVDDWYNTEASEEFEYVLYKDIERCAEHFFKLGMAVSNKA